MRYKREATRILNQSSPEITQVLGLTKEETMSDETFSEPLEKISEEVEKIPAWKKEGWAILYDEPPYCGAREPKLNKEYKHHQRTNENYQKKL